ncbi:hypothetical protein JCM8097_002907 [Rhodosporidiobolus ruineniae]
MAPPRPTRLHRLLALPPSVPLSSLVALLSHSLLSISFLVFINSASPFLLTSLLGIPSSHTGTLTARLLLADELTALAAYLLIGAVTDSHGVRPVAVAGHLVAAGGLVAYTSVRSVGALLAARVVFAVGAGTLVTTMSSMLSAVTAAASKGGVPGRQLAEEGGEEARVGEQAPLLGSSRAGGGEGAQGEAGAAGRLAGLMGFASGCGALLAVFGFLRLPNLLSRLLARHQPPSSNGEEESTDALSLVLTFYLVAAVAVVEAGALAVMLPRRAKRRVAEESEARVEEPLGRRVGRAVKGLFEGFRLARQSGEVALGYASSFASRAQAVILMAYVPLLVNRYLTDHDLCDPEATTAPASSFTCHRAYVLSSIITGSVQLLSLLLSPLIGYLSSTSSSSSASSSSPLTRNPQSLTLFLSFALGALSFLGFALLPHGGDPRAPISWLYVVGMGASQAAGIVLSLALVTTGRGKLTSEDGREEKDVAGVLSGSYALSGGLGILLVGSTAGFVFDRWYPGAPFLLMALVDGVVALGGIMAHPFVCQPCGRTCNSPQQWDEHLLSAGHSRRHKFLKQLKKGVKPGSFACDACSIDDTVDVLETEVDFGFIEFETVFSNSEAQYYGGFTVRTGESACEVVAQLGLNERSESGRKHFTVQGGSINVLPNSTRKIHVDFFPRQSIGSFEDTVTLKFTMGRKYFFFRRPIRAVVGSSADISEFKAREPYSAQSSRPTQPRALERDTVDAPRDATKGQAGIKWQGSLGRFPVEPWLRNLLESSNSKRQIREITGRLPGLSYETYKAYWSTLSQAERVQAEIDARAYDLYDMRLNKSSRGNELIYLDVPGLAEKRPSVLRGDKIKVRNSNGTGKWYAGIVVDVQLAQVGLRFDKSFKPSPSTLFDVQFSAADVPVRRELHTLSQPLPRKELLFPQPGAYYPGPPSSSETRNHTFFSTPIGTNPHQREAVLSILYRSHGPAPFVIFGPPGTGKTVTLIEACQQLLLHQPNSILLLTAPSNAAADLLCQRLELEPDLVLRLNAPSREPRDVSGHVKPYCFEQNGAFGCPPLAELKKFRVIVSTCISASILAGVGLARGHFSVIVVDEAGQAKEPETFLPISLAGPDTSVILAGDPKQLGPVVRSPAASALGLDKSLLERLMEHPDYLATNLDMRGVTYSKLTHNYRNHASILSPPNEMFYEDELEARAPVSTTNTLQRWSGWPNRDFPIIFHAVKGNDEREGRSPSFFNVAEITLVKAYVELLQTRSSGVDIKDADIGIIAPYNAQVKKLRQALHRPSMTIGSVEKMQGQERTVIIMSTVRSNQEYLDHDKRFALGFIDSPKRFNVSVTRAQAGLIIVGDPAVLALDAMWRRFLLYVYDHGGWAGQDWDADRYRGDDVDPARMARQDADELARMFGGLDLDGDGDEDDGADVRNSEYGSAGEEE